MHRHSWLVLLGVAVLGFFIAILVDHGPPSLVFAGNTSTLWAWGRNNEGQLVDDPTVVIVETDLCESWYGKMAVATA